MARVKTDRDGEEDREAPGMGFCSIDIWVRSELELAWSKKSSSYFERNFQYFYYLVFQIWYFKRRDILHWVNFLAFFAAPSVRAGNILFPIYFLFFLSIFIYIKGFFVTVTNRWWFCWYCWWWGFFSVFSWSWIHITLIRSHHSCNRHWSRTTMLCITAAVLKICWNSQHSSVLNELLLEAEWSEVVLIWCFVSIKFINFLKKFLF